MLNLNENMNAVEELEKNSNSGEETQNVFEQLDTANNFKEETQNVSEQNNFNFNVNFFGAGREYEDWH